jgi:hypothetical protein
MGNVFGGTFIGTVSQGGVTLTSGSGPGLSAVPESTSPQIGSVDTGGPVVTVAVFGRYAYVGDAQENLLLVYDISVPSSPQLIAQSEIEVSPNMLATDGNYVYVADLDLNLEAIDVTDPSQPVNLDRVSLNDMGFATSLSIAGHYAYVGGNDGEADIVYVVDISNPSTPVLTGSTSFGFGASLLAQEGRYVFGVDENDNTIAGVNVSDPTNPSVIGTTGIGANPVGIAVSGRYAYVVNAGDGNLQVVDISNPGNLTSVSTTPTAGTPSSIVVADHYAYVIGESSGGFLQIFDVSNPTTPVSLGSRSTADSPIQVVVSGRYAFLVSSNDHEFQVFDLGGADLAQVEAASIEAGNLQVRNNVNIGNDLAVRGGISGANGQIGGDLGVQGNVTVVGNVGIGTDTPGFTLQVNGTVAGVGAYNNISDERYKQNITPLTHALDKIMNIEGVEYNWRTNEFPKINFDHGTQIGFIAQQLKDVLPEAVTQDSSGYYSIAYSKVIPVLVEAMKDQQKEIANKDAELSAIKQHDAEVEARLTALENALKTVAENKH